MVCLAPEEHVHEVLEAEVLSLALIAEVLQSPPVIQIQHEVLSWQTLTASLPAPHLCIAHALDVRL